MARLSTVVDHVGSTRRSAADTRSKILSTARLAFSHAGFDQLGVRELAASAGVDPAVVIRLFGSKEQLFAAVAKDAFVLETPFEGPLSGLGHRIAKHLAGPRDPAGPGEFDEFAFLMRSAASPVAGPLLSAALHERFIAPLAKLLGGKDAPMRAALLTACVLGFATLRVALGSAALNGASRTRLSERLGSALQACVTP